MTAIFSFEGGEVSCLVVEYNGSKSKLCPETCVDIDLTSNCGIFDTRPMNGNFYFNWTETKFTMEVAKYGDGCGGSLRVEIPLNPESHKQLYSVLPQMIKYLHDHENDE